MDHHFADSALRAIAILASDDFTSSLNGSARARVNAPPKCLDGRLRCSGCTRYLPPEAFDADPYKASGRVSRCIACRRKRTTAQRIARHANAPRTDGQKPCPQCHETLPLVSFAVDRGRPDGRAGCCRACRAALQRARKAARVDAVRG